MVLVFGLTKSRVKRSEMTISAGMFVSNRTLCVNVFGINPHFYSSRPLLIGRSTCPSNGLPLHIPRASRILSVKGLPAPSPPTTCTTARSPRRSRPGYTAFTRRRHRKGLTSQSPQSCSFSWKARIAGTISLITQRGHYSGSMTTSHRILVSSKLFRSPT